MARDRGRLDFILMAIVLLTSSSHLAKSAKILLYPFGHCLNSHLLSAERMAEILVAGGHEVDMLLSSAYSSYQHHSKPIQSAPGQCASKFSKMTEGICQKDSASWNTSGEEFLVKVLGSPAKNSCEGKSGSSFKGSSGTNDHKTAEDMKINKKGKLNLLQFQSPKDYTPVCEFDSLDYMISAPINDRFDSLIHTSVKYCDAIFSDPVILKRIKSTPYSVLILESVDPCSRVLADYLDLPFILLYTTGLGHFDSNPRPPSYLPAPIAPFTMSMSFSQRVVNLVLKLMYDRAIPAYMGFMDHFEKLKERHGINTTLSVDDTFSRASLKFVNSDFSVEYPAPIEPDTVLVGGFGVAKPSKLPQDLQEFADGAGKDGLIVFSFGTLIRKYGEQWTKMFMQALGRLPQRVVWRYNEEIANLSSIPPNIKLVKWLPQISLLAHPNTRLFISHCGLNALFEAAEFGVPVLALPLSGDQFNNAAKIAHHLNMGVHVDITTMTAESLYAALLQVLSDPIYAANAKSVASLLRDQPMSAADKIIFWVNYVIRHNGAPHLHSAANSIPLYQYFCLDVIAVLMFVITVVLTILSFCCYKLLKLTLRLSFFVSSKLFGNVFKYNIVHVSDEN